MEYFIKFGKKEHIEKLFQIGEIFMKPMDYYRNCENPEIKDPLEGVKAISNYNRLELFHPNEKGDGPGEKIGILDGIFKEYPTQMFEGNLFCVYMLTKEDFLLLEKEGVNAVNIDANLNSYDYICVINATNFIKKIEDTFEYLDIPMIHGKVEYLDYKNNIESLTPFNKDIKHKHQKEYRFIIPTPNKVDLSIIIGSLKNIAVIAQRKRNVNIRFQRKSI